MTGRDFVSGLPFERAAQAEGVRPDSAVARGLQLLRRIRARAAADADALAPATLPRFNGSERQAPDPDAIEAKADYDALLALCDGISSDTALAVRVAALLARKVPA